MLRMSDKENESTKKQEYVKYVKFQYKKWNFRK